MNLEVGLFAATLEAPMEKRRKAMTDGLVDLPGRFSRLLHEPWAREISH